MASKPMAKQTPSEAFDETNLKQGILKNLKRTTVYAGFSFMKPDGQFSNPWGKFSTAGESRLNTFHTYILPELNNDGSGEVAIMRDGAPLLADDFTIEKSAQSLIIKIKPEIAKNVPSIPTAKQVENMKNHKLAGDPDMSGLDAYKAMVDAAKPKSAEEVLESATTTMSEADIDAMIAALTKAKESKAVEKPKKKKAVKKAEEAPKEAE